MTAASAYLWPNPPPNPGICEKPAPNPPAPGPGKAPPGKTLIVCGAACGTIGGSGAILAIGCGIQEADGNDGDEAATPDDATPAPGDGGGADAAPLAA
jgi:hypothetical protein